MCSQCLHIWSKSKTHPNKEWTSSFLSSSHFNVISVKHRWSLILTMLQAYKKVLMRLHLWGPKVWRGSAVKQPCIWVCNLMPLTCLFCISAFAYVHLQHNCKKVLSDHHSWNKNPKHQLSHLERGVMSGNTHSHSLPTITREFHSSREALFQGSTASWPVEQLSPPFHNQAFPPPQIMHEVVFSTHFEFLPTAGSPCVMVRWCNDVKKTKPQKQKLQCVTVPKILCFEPLHPPQGLCSRRGISSHLGCIHKTEIWESLEALAGERCHLYLCLGPLKFTSFSFPGFDKSVLSQGHA